MSPDIEEVCIKQNNTIKHQRLIEDLKEMKI